MKNKLLDKINSPEDLKKLELSELPVLCEEIRELIIDVISKNSGHLGASLGAVELAVAIHYVYNTPKDKLVWDVGHQAYAHKIITGRKHLFHTIRQYKGISGFPRISESVYDAFGTGHSSTSISAILGMAIASKLLGDNETKHIAVIGDGSIGGGMALEALNHTGVSNTDILIILNDNNIAIDKNVGAIKEYLTDITTSYFYNKMKDDVYKTLGGLSKLGKLIQRLISKIANAIKTSLIKESNLFQSLHIRYFGPVDGNDVIRLVNVLQDLKNIPGPKILHCITTKGKGYEKAEQDQTLWHSPAPFNVETGEFLITDNNQKSKTRFQDVFGQTLLELAKMNPKIVGVTPAMATGCSMNIMMKEMPDRVFDVGIAEQHAVTFSAGLARAGLIPYCNIYSTFIQRAYDQVIHDVALQKLHVVFCVDRAGLVGEDGATHHGFFDLVYMKAIPNIIVAAPMDEIELRNMLYTAQTKNHGPFCIRYPRGTGIHQEWRCSFSEIPIGKGRVIREGKDLAIITIGTAGLNVINVEKKLLEFGINYSHYDLRFAKPLDEELLHYIFNKYHKIISIEDGIITGGIGSAINDFARKNNYKNKIVILGIPDYFVEHGSIDLLQKECGFDSESIVENCKKLLNS